MPIWTFDLPDDVQPNLVLDLSTLSVVTAPGTGSAITVEADESLNPLLDVTADGAKVSIRQIALVGRERLFRQRASSRFHEPGVDRTSLPPGSGVDLLLE